MIVSSGLLAFRIGGNFTNYFTSLTILSLPNIRLDVLIADLLKSDILLLLDFSNDILVSGLTPSISYRALIMARATGSCARVTPSFWSKVVLLVELMVVAPIDVAAVPVGFRLRSYSLELY